LPGSSPGQQLSTANKGGIDAFVTQIRWDESLSGLRTVQYFGYLGTTGDDEAYALATSEQGGPGNSIVYVGGVSEGATAFSPVGNTPGLPNFANDLLYPASGSTIPVSRGFLARISAVNEGSTNLPATLQNLVNVGGRTFATGAQPIQRVLSVAPYLVNPAENQGVLFFTGSTNANNVLPTSPPAPYNVFQNIRANNMSDRKDAYLGSVRLTP